VPVIGPVHVDLALGRHHLAGAGMGKEVGHVETAGGGPLQWLCGTSLRTNDLPTPNAPGFPGCQARYAIG
jgi:hypothetical protein